MACFGFYRPGSSQSLAYVLNHREFNQFLIKILRRTRIDDFWIISSRYSEHSCIVVFMRSATVFLPRGYNAAAVPFRYFKQRSAQCRDSVPTDCRYARSDMDTIRIRHILLVCASIYVLRFSVTKVIRSFVLFGSKR